MVSSAPIWQSTLSACSGSPLPFVKVQLVHLRLRYRRQLLLGHGFFHALGNQRLQHFALDVLGEFSPDQRNRSLAAAESRHVCQAREFLLHALNLVRHFFGWNFQFQLAAARCFSHAKILSWDPLRFLTVRLLVSTACDPV